MRILTVMTSSYPFVGGIETQTRLVVHELAARGHHVEVSAANFEHTSLPHSLRMLHEGLLPPKAESFWDEGIKVHAVVPTRFEQLRMLPLLLRAFPKLRYSKSEETRRFVYPFYRAVYVPKLRKLMKDMDIVHSTAGDYMGWAAEEAARAEGIPFLVTPYVHPGNYGDDDDNIAYYKRADIVFALLETDRDKLIGLGVPAERLRLSGVVPLLPESADPEGFRRAHGLEGKPIIVFVGRHEPYKGPLALLEAAPKVWETHPDTHFLFIGPSTPDSEQWFAERSDESRIRYLGKVSDQEKADAMAACDIFAMPSSAEVLPAVYLEAWSYARAVLGGTAHGLPELIEGNGAGLTVGQDPADVADAIGELLSDDTRRAEMGARGQELVNRRFSKQGLVGSLENTYREVIEGAASRGRERQQERENHG